MQIEAANLLWIRLPLPPPRQRALVSALCATKPVLFFFLLLFPVLAGFWPCEAPFSSAHLRNLVSGNAGKLSSARATTRQM